MGMFDDVTDIKTLLGELAGAASVCWEPNTGDAVFDSEQATKFVDAAHERLQKIIREGWVKRVAPRIG